MDTVLVTGGTGFIARRCVVQLIEEGFDVRTSVRALDREPDVRAAVSEAVDPRDRLTVVAADLTTDEGWSAAVAGCRYVLHPASPLGGAPPDRCARRNAGRRARVLRAATDAGSTRGVDLGRECGQPDLLPRAGCD